MKSTLGSTLLFTMLLSTGAQSAILTRDFVNQLTDAQVTMLRVKPRHRRTQKYVASNNTTTTNDQGGGTEFIKKRIRKVTLRKRARGKIIAHSNNRYYLYVSFDQGCKTKECAYEFEWSDPYSKRACYVLTGFPKQKGYSPSGYPRIGIFGRLGFTRQHPRTCLRFNRSKFLKVVRDRRVSIGHND